MSDQDLLVAWLNDADGMENALVQVLEHQVKDAEEYPQIQAMIQQHLEQTRRHADLVESCVQRLGGSTSTLKTGFATLFGQFQALSTGGTRDEMVKNALADFAAENFEIASYNALIAAAQAVGDRETASICQQILQDEQTMARWLEQNLPMITQDALQKVAATA